MQRTARQPGVLGHGRARADLPRDAPTSSRTPSPTLGNFFNITRNFAVIGIMALGMTAVIITGGIDLSVGSIMGAGRDRRRRCVLEAGLSLVRRPASPAWSPGLPAARVNGVFDRLCRPAALRGDARHAVDRPLARDRAVAEPDDLPVRPRRRRSSRRSAAARSTLPLVRRRRRWSCPTCSSRCWCSP